MLGKHQRPRGWGGGERPFCGLSFCRGSAWLKHRRQKRRHDIERNGISLSALIVRISLAKPLRAKWEHPHFREWKWEPDARVPKRLSIPLMPSFPKFRWQQNETNKRKSHLSSFAKRGWWWRKRRRWRKGGGEGGKESIRFRQKRSRNKICV